MSIRLLRAPAVVALAFLLALPVCALDSDKNQAATLQADDLEFDLETGVRTYRGNVVFRQGSIHLDCDQLETHHNEDGKLKMGVCTGNPGRFKQRPEGRDSDALGRALTITLDRVNAVVILNGRADIELAGDQLRGQRITYDLETRKTRVSDGADAGKAASPTAGEAGGGANARPRITIQPRQNEPG